MGKKNQAKAFTNLIWREEWSQQAETYSLYYDAGGQLQQLQIHYADGKAKRYAYDTSMREVYHEEGQFWEKEEIGLIQLTEETKPDEKEKNVYRQPAAEVFKALYLPVLEEEKGETPLFIGSQGKYLITEAEQLKTLSHLISEEEEIEPGIRADEASYYLCSDLTIEDWVQIGGVLTPFKGQFYGNGHTVTGFGFSISDDTLGSYEKVFDLNRESPLIPQEEMTVIPRKELEAVFGQEGEQLLEQLLDKEGNVLEQTQMKVLENKMVSCVLSLTGNREDEIHLLLKSEGEGEEFFQHCVFEANDLVMPDYVCYLSEADINYDGNEDILLYQGHTGGTSRGYGVFYAMVWNEAEQRYEEFPSFPPYVFSAEFNEQRLIDTIEIGVSENGVVVYGIVDGEYREVESLHLILKSAKAYNEEESGWVWQLLHYEMGQLTEDRIVPTDIEAIRKEYPHLDYWERG